MLLYEAWKICHKVLLHCNAHSLREGSLQRTLLYGEFYLFHTIALPLGCLYECPGFQNNSKQPCCPCHGYVCIWPECDILEAFPGTIVAH